MQERTPEPPCGGLLDRLIGPLIALAAFIVYAATLSRGVYPGESASFLVEMANLFPRFTAARPVLGLLGVVVTAIPVATLSLRFNLLSAVSCALALWALYNVTARTVFHAAAVAGDEDEHEAWKAARFAGLAAAFFLGFSIPFWSVATRAHPIPFGILLLLVTSRILLHYLEYGSRRALYMATFLYAVGMVEFPAFILLSPMAVGALALTITLWRDARTSCLVTVGLCGLAGLSLYLVSAGLFCFSQGYELGNYSGFFQVLWFVWRDQLQALVGSVPRTGWMMVFLLTFTPWLLSYVIGVSALREPGTRLHFPVHVLMSVMVLAVLLNSELSPWSITRGQRTVVTPYVLAAGTYGYLTAFWILLPRRWWPHSRSRVMTWLRTAVGVIFLGLCLLPLYVMPSFNEQHVDSHYSGPINAFARQIVGCASDKDWLITDGSLDETLMVAAHETGSALKFCNVRAGRHPSYMRYMAADFEDPQLKSLSQVGMLAFLNEWLRSEQAADSGVAVLTVPDLWFGAGKSVVPDRLLFLGTDDTAGLDSDAILADHERFWASTVEPLQKIRTGPGWLLAFRDSSLRHMSFVANNLGVLFQDLDRDDDAFLVYEQARTIDPLNVSALLNMARMVETGYQTPKAEMIREELEELKTSTDQEKRRQIWGLSRRYGYVRTPAAYARLGMVWALSGQPGLAASGIEKAVNLLPEDQRQVMEERVAAIYLWDGQQTRSEEIFRHILRLQPDNAEAVLGLIRLAAVGGRMQEAVELLDRAAKLGVPRTRLSSESAILHLLSGETARARIVMEEAVDLDPEHLPGWALLAGILTEQKDVPGLERCLQHVQKLEDDDGIVGLVIGGRIAMLRYDWNRAATCVREAMKRRPRDTQLMEWNLRLNLIRGNREAARSSCRALLRRDPGHAYANYAMASFQSEDGEYRLAEAALRRSLARRPSVLAHNNLAWLLQYRRQREEAEIHARAALKLDPDSYQPWDTLGEILMNDDRLDEAEEALLRALSIEPNSAPVLVHLADLQTRLERWDRAREIVHLLEGKQSELSTIEYERLVEVRRKVEFR